MLARRYEDALPVDVEVVGLYREQTETDTTPTAAFGFSLGRLADELAALGRHDEALRVAEERVDLYRKATASSPNADLASSLDALSAHLHELGDRTEDVLVACEEAVELRRNLPEATDSILPLSLAASMENLGVFLRAQGRHGDSLSMAQEAVDLYRKIIATDPYLTALDTPSPKNLLIRFCAHSLENLAFSLSAVGRAEDAAQAAAESVDLYRSIGDDKPEVKAGLATVLCSLAVFLRTVNRDEDASRAEKEGAEMFRTLAVTDLELTARSLRGFARDLRSIGLREDALRAQEQSAHHYRTITQTRPALLRVHVKSLQALAEDLRVLGRAEDAARTEAEVADIEGLHSL
ncbi:hypothetical protein K438DRAFT_1111014 [Mycena galopus ATCC 62051]|nr:hypothetical protein K438DRAFT_1111014 [Mycena galopus ATCC 62051]